MKHSVTKTTRKYKGQSICYSLTKSPNGYTLWVNSSAYGSVCVEDIACDIKSAENIKNLLANNLVFPENVYEILDDIIGT